MSLNILTLGSSKTYTKETALGGGAIVGKNVQISKIEPIMGGNCITFSYTLDDGTVKTSLLNVMNGEQGISVIDADVSKNILTLKLSNGDIIPAGEIKIDSSKLKLDNYYTKTDSDELYIHKNDMEIVSSDDIKDLFN